MDTLALILVLAVLVVVFFVWRRRSGCVKHGQWGIPACPKGMITCPGKQKGYCYDPATKMMVSTYQAQGYDACPSEAGSTGNAPIAITGENILGANKVWVRQKGWDAAFCGPQPAGV
jgi:hypothetical protein